MENSGAQHTIGTNENFPLKYSKLFANKVGQCFLTDFSRIIISKHKAVSNMMLSKQNNPLKVRR